MTESNIHVDDFPRLIMGMPRAATTWMCKCLNAHPDAAAFGESSIWGRAFVEPQEDGTYDAAQLKWIVDRLKDGGVLKSTLGDQPGCLQHLTEASFPQHLDRAFDGAERLTPREVHQCMAAAVAEGEGKPCAIEKSPHHLMWLDRIMTYAPDAKCIVMLREPYGFMLSYKHWIGRDDYARKRFRQRYHPIACALVWKAYMRAAAEAGRKYGNQLLFVHVEDVKRDAQAVLAEAQRFFGLSVVPLADKVPPDNTSFQQRKRPELRGADVFWMNRIAGNVARQAGYDLKPVGGDWLGILWSIMRMPAWALQNVGPLRRQIRGSFLRYLWNWVRPRRGEVTEQAAR